METKKCILCEKELPIYKFYAGAFKGGKNTRCISCLKIVKRSDNIRLKRMVITPNLKIKINKEYDNELMTLTEIAHKHSISLTTVWRNVQSARSQGGVRSLL